MSDETEPTLQPDLDGEPQDLIGAGVVALFRQSADLAEGNSRYAWKSLKCFRFGLSQARTGWPNLRLG
jgi:hypothetical protein